MRDGADLTWKEMMHLLRSWRLLLLVALLPGVGFVVYQNIRWLVAETERSRTLVELNRQQVAASISWEQVERWGFYAVVPVRPSWVYDHGYWGRWGHMFHVDAGGRVRWVGRQWAYEQWGAMVEPLDFADLVVGVLALMAILFTYDAVSGERERGTWALLMTTPVSRSTVLMAKWVGRTIPIGIVTGLTWLALWVGVTVQGLIPSFSDWVLESLVVLGLAWVFVGGAALWGILTSVWARTSATSLMVAILGWLGVTWIGPRYVATWVQLIDPPAEAGTVNISVTLMDKQLEERYWRWIASEWARGGPTAVQAILADPERTEELRRMRDDTFRQTRELQQEAERQTLRYVHALRWWTLWSPVEDFRRILSHWVGTGWPDVEQAHARALDYGRRFSEWVDRLRQQARSQYAVLLDRSDPFERSRPDLSSLPRQVDMPIPWRVRWVNVWPEAIAGFTIYSMIGLLAFVRFRTDRPY